MNSFKTSVGGRVSCSMEEVLVRKSITFHTELIGLSLPHYQIVMLHKRSESHFKKQKSLSS
jgi:hypothetical protein